MRRWPVLEREPVQLPILAGHDHTLWKTLLELADLRPRGRALIGWAGVLPRSEKMPVLSFRTLGMEHGTCAHVSQNHYGNAVGGKPPNCGNTRSGEVRFVSAGVRECPEDIFHRKPFQSRIEDCGCAQG